jgi:hypothetical protein
MALRLAQYLRDGGITGTDAEIVLALQGNLPAFEDHSPYRWDKLLTFLASRGVARETLLQIDSFLLAVPMGSLLTRMLDQGADLALPQVQQLLLDLQAEAIPATATLLSLIAQAGITYQPTWQVLGLPAAPDARDVSAAKDENDAVLFARELVEQVLNTEQLAAKNIQYILDQVVARTPEPRVVGLEEGMR